jgi:hypothetical protein
VLSMLETASRLNHKNSSQVFLKVPSKYQVFLVDYLIGYSQFSFDLSIHISNFTNQET